ncbi:sensor histidine kinase [Cetobacterium sp.]|uniref:sensor histidine kinase n=1 Tax=Cetobacterium sp. TaxID=2071632 RepID=UPI003F2C1428
MKKSSLSKKISIYSGLIISIAMFVNYFIGILFLEAHFISERKLEFPEIVKKIQILLKSNSEEELKNYVKNLKEKRDITLLIMAEEEKRWINTGGGTGTGFLIDDLEDKKFIIKKQRMTEAKILLYNEKVGNRWISVRTSLSILDYYKKEIAYFNSFGALVALFIALIFAKIFSKKFVEDIEILKERTEKISNLDFREDFKIDREDELGELSENIESMSKKLEVAIKDLESFVSNTSHELKTPIAIISSRAQLLMEKESQNLEIVENCRVILKESYYTKELITKLLILSKLDVIKDLKTERVFLKVLIEKIVQRYDYLEFSKNLCIDLDINEEVIITDKEFFQIALENIIQNSLKYSVEDGEVKIFLKDGILKIENEIMNSSSINTEDIFNPFERGKNYLREEGTGLGLTLVKKILLLLNLRYDVSIKENKFIFMIYLK